MSRMTLDSLREFRAEKKEEIKRQEVEENFIRIIIGMGTCGIAAGAREALNVFQTEADARKMENVVVKQTGCMGFCHAEPTVEVRMSGMPNTLYGRVDAETAMKIVETHLLGGKLVNEHVFDYPSGDIYKE